MRLGLDRTCRWFDFSYDHPCWWSGKAKVLDDSFILDQHDTIFGDLMFFRALIYFSRLEAMDIESNHFQVRDLIQMP